MSDLADIERAFVALLGAALFPGGGYLPGAYATSIAGVPAVLYRGWPVAAQLDTDLIAGRAHVSVFPEPGMSKLTTRFAPAWFVPGGMAAPTLTASVAGAVVTFGGTGGAGQVAGVQFGPSAAPAAFAFRLSANDTPSTVAAAFAALITGATASGPALMLPTFYNASATVVADTTALQEVRRQEQGIRVSVWAPTPAARDALAGAADLALAGMVDGYGNLTEYLPLPAGDSARICYRATMPDDKPAKAHVWRRDLRYSAEYGTTLAQAFPVMLFGVANVQPNNAAIPPQEAPDVPQPIRIGAIRWDAWYDPATPLTQAVAADLSPAQFNHRAPFFAAVSGGVVTLPAAAQATMDAEITVAANAGLAYWAFNIGPLYGTALGLYLASSIRSRIGFCAVQSTSDLYFQGAYQPAFAALAALTGQAGYQTVMDNRPLIYLNDSGDADILYRYGTYTAFQNVVGALRQAVMATVGRNPYIVILSGWNVRGAKLAAQCGFDAIGSYAEPAAITGVTPYSELARTTEAWWTQTAAMGVAVVPPVMAGWNFTPRIVTPNALFPPDEVAGSAGVYYQDGGPSQIAAHVGHAVAWMQANPQSATAQTALVYAWNEFDEGGYVCPTYLPGNTAGDASRLTAIGTVLT